MVSEIWKMSFDDQRLALDDLSAPNSVDENITKLGNIVLEGRRRIIKKVAESTDVICISVRCTSSEDSGARNTATSIRFGLLTIDKNQMAWKRSKENVRNYPSRRSLRVKNRGATFRYVSETKR